nr:MAG TPA: hypothetical protein [Caudoviricetes sp.]
MPNPQPAQHQPSRKEAYPPRHHRRKMGRRRGPTPHHAHLGHHLRWDAIHDPRQPRH